MSSSSDVRVSYGFSLTRLGGLFDTQHVHQGKLRVLPLFAVRTEEGMNERTDEIDPVSGWYLHMRHTRMSSIPFATDVSRIHRALI